MTRITSGLLGWRVMTKRRRIEATTRFEQVPLEIAKKALQKKYRNSRSSEGSQAGTLTVGSISLNDKSFLLPAEFQKVLEKFETIKAQFSLCSDPDERSKLLEEMGHVIDEVDGVIMGRTAKLELK